MEITACSVEKNGILTSKIQELFLKPSAEAFERRTRRTRREE